MPFSVIAGSSDIRTCRNIYICSPGIKQNMVIILRCTMILLRLKYIFEHIIIQPRMYEGANAGGSLDFTRWRHPMETFSAVLGICAGNSPVPGEFPAQRPVTRNFDVFFDLRLNKRLRKQSWDWWFETLSRPLWRHCNDSFPQGPRLLAMVHNA